MDGISPFCIFLYIGQRLMLIVDGPWLKRGVAALLVLMAAQQICTRLRTKRALAIASPAGLDLTQPRIQLSILVHFSLGGFVGGIATVGGTPLMLFVARNDNNPEIDPSLPPALRDFIGLTFRRVT